MGLRLSGEGGLDERDVVRGGLRLGLDFLLDRYFVIHIMTMLLKYFKCASIASLVADNDPISIIWLGNDYVFNTTKE